jgi:hypothetical protein
MPNYSNLSTQVEAIKSEITSSLAASAYSAQDLVYVAKALQALGSVVAPDGVSNITVNDNIYLGATAESWTTTAGLTNPTLVIRNTEASAQSTFAQVAFTNSDSTSSTDYIAYMNNGNDSAGWVGMGIAGSTFDDTTYGITGPGDAYIFHDTLNDNYDGNLVFATGDSGAQNKLVFAAGGFASGDTQMSITPAATGVPGNVHIEIQTPSTSPSTGALTVVGGVGIQGDVNIAGNITFGGSGTTVETGSLAVDNSIIFVGNNNSTDALDLGLLAEYATGITPSTNTITNKALTSDVATLTTGTAHGYAVGDIAVISGVDATFNGTYVIESVPTTTTFTFTKDAANVTSAAVSPAGAVTVSAKRRFAGVVRDASDAVVKFFQDATTKPSTTVNFGESGLTYADIRVDDITADAITATSATIGDVDNTEIQYLNGVTSGIQSQIDSKLSTSTAASTYAPLASPSLTGTPLAPTAAVDTNTTQIATTAYVVGQGYLKSSAASSTYAPLTGASLVSPVLQSPEEVVTVSATSATGTVNVDLATSGIHYYTANSAADWTFNFRGNSGTTLNSMLNVGGTITVAFMVTNGSTGYKPTGFQIDGVTLTGGTAVKWSGGTAPSQGNANSIDVYTFTIVKTASATYTVLGAQSKFA